MLQGMVSIKTWLTLYIYGIFTHASGLLQLFFDDHLRGRGDKDSVIITQAFTNKHRAEIS